MSSISNSRLSHWYTRTLMHEIYPRVSRTKRQAGAKTRFVWCSNSFSILSKHTLARMRRTHKPLGYDGDRTRASHMQSELTTTVLHAHIHYYWVCILQFTVEIWAEKNSVYHKMFLIMMHHWLCGEVFLVRMNKWGKSDFRILSKNQCFTSVRCWCRLKPLYSLHMESSQWS